MDSRSNRDFLPNKIRKRAMDGSVHVDTELNRFSQTVGHIYQAGLDSDKWPLALKALCEELGADKAQMLYLDPKEYKISFACGYGFDPYAHNIGASRFRSYFFDDPVAQYGITHLNEVFSDRRVIAPDVLHASGMHREIRSPANMEHLLTGLLTDGSPDWSGFCFFRQREQQAFSPHEEMILSRYAPHLKRSTYIHKSVAGAIHLQSLQNAVLDDLDTGILVVDELHDVVICNKVAQRIIDNSGVLKLSDRRLTCRYPRENSMLHEAIDEAISESANDSVKRRIAVRLRGVDQTESILAVTTQLQNQRFEEKLHSQQLSKAHYTARIPSKKNVLITLCDPINFQRNHQEMLQHMFELTPAEAALANCLADDCSLDEAAQKLGRTVGTARVQLQSIFNKTDTNRQSSLIKLIVSIP